MNLRLRSTGGDQGRLIRLVPGHSWHWLSHRVGPPACSTPSPADARAGCHLRGDLAGRCPRGRRSGTSPGPKGKPDSASGGGGGHAPPRGPACESGEGGPDTGCLGLQGFPGLPGRAAGRQTAVLGSCGGTGAGGGCDTCWESPRGEARLAQGGNAPTDPGGDGGGCRPACSAMLAEGLQTHHPLRTLCVALELSWQETEK